MSPLRWHFWGLKHSWLSLCACDLYGYKYTLHKSAHKNTVLRLLPPPTLYFTDMYREVCKSACKLNDSIAQLVRAWQALSFLWVSFWVSSHTGLQVYLCTDHLEEYNMSNLIACSLWAYLIGRATIGASQEVCSTPRVYKSVQLPGMSIPWDGHRGISSEYA